MAIASQLVEQAVVDVTTKHLLVHGRVQGVFYRESMRQRALRLGVTGWVRNRIDGSVEAVVQGEASAVAEMIEWARRGPSEANVTTVQIADGSGTYSSFEKLPTH